MFVGYTEIFDSTQSLLALLQVTKTDSQGVLQVPQEENRLNELLTYPNPFTNQISIRNVAPKTRYTLFNAIGSVVSSGLVRNGRIESLGHLPSGYYALILQVEETVQRLSIIKE